MSSKTHRLSREGGHSWRPLLVKSKSTGNYEPRRSASNGATIHRSNNAPLNLGFDVLETSLNSRVSDNHNILTKELHQRSSNISYRDYRENSNNERKENYSKNRIFKVESSSSAKIVIMRPEKIERPPRVTGQQIGDSLRCFSLLLIVLVSFASGWLQVTEGLETQLQSPSIMPSISNRSTIVASTTTSSAGNQIFLLNRDGQQSTNATANRTMLSIKQNSRQPIITSGSMNRAVIETNGGDNGLIIDSLTSTTSLAPMFPASLDSSSSSVTATSASAPRDLAVRDFQQVADSTKPVETLVTSASKKKKKVVKKKKKMEKKHKEWKKGKKHKKKKYESKKKKGGMEKKKKGKKEKKKWGMEKKGHKKKGNFKKKKWGMKKKMKKGQKKGKKGHKMLKDKGHKKKGFKKVYHKEEWGKKKKWHDIKREKKWNTKQKKWKKKWKQEKGKKYKGKHMKKYHKKNKHGKKYKKEKKSKWKKQKGEKFKKGHKKKKEEYAKKKEGGKKKKMKKMKKEMKKKKG